MTEIIETKCPQLRTFQEAAEILTVDLTGTPEEIADQAVGDINRALIYQARSGLGLAALKEQTEHGQFVRLIEERGLSRQRASEAMQLADLLKRLPEHLIERLIKIPKRRAIELARADNEVIGDLIEQDEFEELAELSVRELKAKLADAKRRIESQEVEKDTLKTQRDDARRQVAARAEGRQTPLFALEVRQESAIAATQIDQYTDHLDHLFDRSLYDLGAENAEDRLHREQAAQHAWHQLYASYSQLNALLQRMHQTFGEVVLHQPQIEQTFSAEEIAAFKATRSVLIGEFNSNAETRNNDRLNSQPGRRGRRHGTKKS